MPTFHIGPFSPSDEETVIALWRACGLVVPHNDPHQDIARKLAVNPEWFLIGKLNGAIIASCMVGYEGHRGWINYLAVHPEHQRRGYAKALMEEAERILKIAGCPKINLQVRGTNTAIAGFYERLGFTNDQTVSYGKRLIRDEPQ